MAELMEAYVGHFAGDATVAPPSGDSVSGSGAILSFYTTAFAGVVPLSLVYDRRDISVEADSGVRRYRGTAIFIAASGTDTVTSVLEYTDVMRRMEDGQWRIVRHSWRSAGN